MLVKCVEIIINTQKISNFGVTEFNIIFALPREPNIRFFPCHIGRKHNIKTSVVHQRFFSCFKGIAPDGRGYILAKILTVFCFLFL